MIIDINTYTKLDTTLVNTGYLSFSITYFIIFYVIILYFIISQFYIIVQNIGLYLKSLVTYL